MYKLIKKIFRRLARLFLINRSNKNAQKIKIDAPSDVLVKAKVLKVIDGDSVLLWMFEQEIEIRLYAIDCPEGNQPWGSNATHALKRLIDYKNVYMQKFGIDHHGRTLAVLFLDNSGEFINVNEYMVKCGHAWVFRIYYGRLPRQSQRKLNQLERWAKTKQVGLWKHKNPIPPWEWRKRA